MDGKPYQLALCDTSGHDDYDRLRPIGYPDTDIIVLCFSIGEPESLVNIEERVGVSPTTIQAQLTHYTCSGSPRSKGWPLKAVK